MWEVEMSITEVVGNVEKSVAEVESVKVEKPIIV